MIITDSDAASPHSSTTKTAEAPLPALPADPVSPPPYTGPEVAFSSTQSTFILPANTKPCNFVSFSQTNTSVKGTYVLDPSLELPTEWLPPLPEDETEETRSNFLAKTENGSVVSDVYLLEKPPLKGRKKVVMNASSNNGSVATYIHREGSSPPFILNASSPYGGVAVRIPRSFKGSITASTKHGHVSMSDAVSAQASLVSDLQGVRRIFVGDLSTRNEETDDVMILESVNGSVKISFEDEDFTNRIVKSVGGLLGRLFG